MGHSFPADVAECLTHFPPSVIPDIFHRESRAPIGLSLGTITPNMARASRPSNHQAPKSSVCYAPRGSSPGLHPNIPALDPRLREDDGQGN